MEQVNNENNENTFKYDKTQKQITKGSIEWI